MIQVLVFRSDGSEITIRVGQPMPGSSVPIADIFRMTDGTGAYRVRLENNDELIIETGVYSVAPYQQTHVETSYT